MNAAAWIDGSVAALSSADTRDRNCAIAAGTDALSMNVWLPANTEPFRRAPAIAGFSAFIRVLWTASTRGRDQSSAVASRAPQALFMALVDCSEATVPAQSTVLAPVRIGTGDGAPRRRWKGGGGRERERGPGGERVPSGARGREGLDPTRL